MKTMHLTLATCGLLLASLAGHPAWADVLNLGGTRDPATGQWTGLASLETVPVGNPGNPGDTRYPDTANGVSSFGSVGYTYNVGKYEVTSGQYCEFLNKVAAVDAYGLYNTDMWSDWWGTGCRIQRSGNGTTQDPYTYSMAADYANRPVNYISFGDACRFANWLHNGQPTGVQGLGTTEDGAYYLNGATTYDALLAVTRKTGWKWAVTSENEWYKAAYYNSATGSYYDYPTSSNNVPGRDLNDASGNNANYYGNPWPIQSPYYTTVVGEFQNSDSPYGTFDQGGNVWEWNETAVYGGDRGTRGGAFNIPGQYLLPSPRCHSIDPENGYANFGFRVAAAPEPATFSLLALGGLLLARRRRA